MSETNIQQGFFQSGTPWVWLNAAAVSISIIMVIGLLLLIAVRGLGHFWPKTIWEIEYQDQHAEIVLLGERARTKIVSAKQLAEAGIKISNDDEFVERTLLKTGNRDVYGFDFKLIVGPNELKQSKPADAIVFERTEWGNFYGFIKSIQEYNQAIELVQPTEGQRSEDLWLELQQRITRVQKLRERIHKLEKNEIGAINYRMEKLRLDERKAELDNRLDAQMQEKFAADKVLLDKQYTTLKAELDAIYQEIGRDSVVMSVMNGQDVEINLSEIIKATRPNSMNLFQKLITYLINIKDFVSEDPREANTEGGIFPAIFGTVMMVLLMAIIVTPFGVIAAIYLREYAKQGFVTRLVRISVNNLAGVPSIVYGVFGLGFFVYFLGGQIDQLFYPEA